MQTNVAIKPFVGAFVVAGLIVAGLMPAAAPASTPSAATRAQLQRELDRSVNARVPGAVLVVRHGDHTLRLASGYAELKDRTRMRTSHRFRVGSVTTSFVATAVLQLVAEGKLALDDTIESRLPGAIPTGGTITLRQLLNMRSGLFDYLNDGDTTVTGALLSDPSHRWAPQDLIAITNRHAPRFAPDTAWSYCDTCYVLLGQIIERTTGHVLADELRQRIFVPAGLGATSFDTEPRIAGRHAHGYERLGRKLRPTDVTAVSPTYIWAAGAIVSTAGDVARFYSKLYGGHLLRPDLLDAMQTTGPMAAELKGWGYGFGLIKKPIGCGTGYGNDAAAPGFSAYAYSSKNASRQSVLLINARDSTMEHEDNGALQHVHASGYCAGQKGPR
jgi:D-alanyl-D-alanine carboxypeptidase